MVLTMRIFITTILLLMLVACSDSDTDDANYTYTDTQQTVNQICQQRQYDATNSCYQTSCYGHCIGFGCLYCWSSCSINSSYDYLSCCATYGCTQSISGFVTDQSGTGINNVTMSLPGEVSQFTNASGFYSFTSSSGGTLTPSKPGFCFDPENRYFPQDYADHSNENFIASVNCFSVTGTIKGSDGTPVSGITVDLTGAATISTVTNANGFYSFNALANGSYTITPVQFSITPITQTATINNSSVANKDFTVAGAIISGNISVADGTPLPDINVELTGPATKTTKTDNNGNYIFPGLVNSGLYTITPSSSCNAYHLDKPSIDINLVDINVANQNFVTTIAAFDINGSITENGSPLSEVTLSRTGSVQATTTSNATGQYSFIGNQNVLYSTIKPSLPGYAFMPADLDIVSCNTGNITQDFIATNSWVKSIENFLWSSMDVTSDENYLLAGGPLENQSVTDLAVMKRDNSGNLLWLKKFAARLWRPTIEENASGEFFLAGTTTDFGAGNNDIWVLKFDAAGNVLWQKTYGETGSDRAYTMNVTPDGGAIVVGISNSFTTGSDVWVLKLDSNGNVSWQKTYDNGASEIQPYIQHTSDGGYILTGESLAPSADNYDIWLMKLDSAGNVSWYKTFGGSKFEWQTSVKETPDGNYLVASSSESFGLSWDAWILKLDTSGKVLWQNTYGGTDFERIFNITATSDNGSIVAGTSKSFNNGQYRLWIFKLDSAGNVNWSKTYGSGGTDMHPSIHEMSDGGYSILEDSMNFNSTIYRTDLNGDIDYCSMVSSSDPVVTKTQNNLVDATITVTTTNAKITDTNVTAQSGTVTTTQVCPSI